MKCGVMRTHTHTHTPVGWCCDPDGLHIDNSVLALVRKLAIEKLVVFFFFLFVK